MRNLVICCDGTWNTRTNKYGANPAPTNVVKLHASVAETGQPGVVQKRFYREGVGTTGGRLRKLKGGATGAGLIEDIESAYKWLAETYEKGDRIYLFGFSRGAYTVRSLAGALKWVGLEKLAGNAIPDAEKWARVKAAIEEFGQEKERTEDTSAPETETQDDDRRWRNVPIRFLGVWDTVGSLGIPDDLAILQRLTRKYGKVRFHDTRLGSNVQTARHAVAIDEYRVDFVPTLWTDVPPERDVKQVWFPGVHGDVGGAYYDRGLGDITLGWMMDEAATAGLEFRSHAKDQLSPYAQGVMHDSLVGLWRKRQTRPRSVPRIDAAPGSLDVSPEARDRNAKPALSEPFYWATQSVGATPETREITSKLRWVPTGLYLEGGVEYAFAAEGEWLDARIKAGPAGPKGPFQLGQIWHKAVAPFDAIICRRRKKTENPAAEFMLLRVTRREPCLPWFSLVGVIANGRGIQASTDRRARHETFLIGDHVDYTPEAGGYLYCFANDAWGFYGNNRGQVTLSVRRK